MSAPAARSRGSCRRRSCAERLWERDTAASPGACVRFGLDARLCASAASAFASELMRALRRRAKKLLGLGSVSEAFAGAVVAIQRTDSAPTQCPPARSGARWGLRARALGSAGVPRAAHAEVTRNRPGRISRNRSRFLAVTKRPSMRRDLVARKRITRRSSARRSLAVVPSATHRSLVETGAARRGLDRARLRGVAPVKAPDLVPE